MTPTLRVPAARLALALGLAAGAVALLPASTTRADTAAAPAGGPERLILAQAAAPAEHPVSYTDEQADRGEKKYTADCEDCHGEDLTGGMNGGAPLKGRAFEDKFANGAPASSMFLFMSTMMPPNDPGRYSPSTYADLMAYILKRNGFQPGAALPSDVEKLDYLIVEK